MGVKISKDLIENRVKDIFPNYIFDFTDYKNTHSKIDFICDKNHKNKSIVKNILKGHGCKLCGNKISSDKQRKNIDDVINKFRNVHADKYDYSKFKYSRNRVPSTIICPNHGEFTQSASTHINGSGCPKCKGNKRLTKDEFIENSRNVHTIPYNYDFVEYKNMHNKVIIVCPKHGPFEQTPNSHTSGKGCPKCNQSIGENLVEKFLQKNNINYISQKKFNDCKHINELVFDFYLPDYNTCIEFNGIQHYSPIEIFGGQIALELNIKRDYIKKEYCLQNKIKLIIIKQDKKHINKVDVLKQIDNISNLLEMKESKIMNFVQFLKK